jgi:hypothetical protein
MAVITTFILRAGCISCTAFKSSNIFLSYNKCPITKNFKPTETKYVLLYKSINLKLHKHLGVVVVVWCMLVIYIYILFGNLHLYNGGNHCRGNSGPLDTKLYLQMTHSIKAKICRIKCA